MEDIHYKHDTRNNHAPINVKPGGGSGYPRGFDPRVGILIVYNYLPKGRWIVVDTYRDTKRRGIYPPLLTDPEGDSCFSIYQIRWIKKRFFNFFF